MAEIKLAAVESQFAEIVWDNAPLRSRELVELCGEKLGWKRTTTYTVLKKLCERGIFQNIDGVVSALLTKDDYYTLQGEKLVDEAFDGSLPAFIAAFTKRKSLTSEEIEEIRQMIDTAKEV